VIILEAVVEPAGVVGVLVEVGVLRMRPCPHQVLPNTIPGLKITL